MKKKNLSLLDAGIIFLVSFALAQLTSVIGVIVTQIILQICGMSVDKISIFWNSAFGYLLQAIYMNIAFVLVFIFYYKNRKHETLIQKPTKHTFIYFIVCVALGIATLFLSAGVLNYFQLLIDKLGFTSSTLSYELDSPVNYLISLVSLALIPAVCEELIFRGLLTTALKQKGQMFAVILSSIMFAIFHFSPSQFFYPIMFGLILSIVYLKTNNIIFPILLHFINNALTVSIQYFSGPSSTTFTHSYFTLIYAIVTFAIWVVAMVFLFKNFKKANSSIPNDTTIDTNSVNNSNPNTQNTSIADNKNLNNLIFYGSICVMLLIYILMLFV